MKVLICTAIPLASSSAALNRLTRMRRALAQQGIDAILVGSASGIDQCWKESESESGRQIVYDPLRTGAKKRYSRALTIASQAAAFYRRNLGELLTHYQCDGVISYVSQAQMGDAILQAARSTDCFVTADMVERFQVSTYYLLNGVYFQQNRLCSRTLPRMDGIIGISHGWCDWSESRGIPNVWIPSFAEDDPRLQRSGGTNNDSFTISFIGHWIRRELPTVILRAIRLCLDRGVDIRMNVIGNVGQSPREQKAMRLLASDPGLKQSIHFTGFVSDEDKNRLLAESDAFVILRPNSRESDLLFPTRLPEYMLTGHPVILSEVGSFKRCFEHRHDVWFVSDQNRVEEVADALTHLASNPHERNEIGRRGRESALKQFSLDVLGKRLATFLEQVGTS